jgi:hypothetical protein
MSGSLNEQFGRYHLVEKIGQGGMGVVWKAIDTRLHRAVALKLLPDDLSDDPMRLDRFEREARMAATLNHPNIVTLHSIEDEGDIPFITMELVEGDAVRRLRRPRESSGEPSDETPASWGDGKDAMMDKTVRMRRKASAAAEERSRDGAEGPEGTSIAVLPFNDLSPGGDQEYFCDGLAEDITSALSRVAGLAAAARTSAFAFKGRSLDVREIGKKLGVSTGPRPRSDLRLAQLGLPREGARRRGPRSPAPGRRPWRQDGADRGLHGLCPRPLRGEPRFQELLERVGLPASSSSYPVVVDATDESPEER